MFSESIRKLNNQYPYGLPSLITKRTMDKIQNILNTYPTYMASDEYLGKEDLPWDVILHNLINLDISKAYLETVKQGHSPEDGPSQDILYNMNHRNKKSSMSMMLRDKHLYGHA